MAAAQNFGPAKINGIAMDMPSQMLAGSLSHFAITFQNASNAAVNISGSDIVKGEVYKVLASKGTPVIVGTLENTGSTLRVALENGGAHWTASDLDTALKALGTVDTIDLSGTDAVGFTY